MQRVKIPKVVSKDFHKCTTSFLAGKIYPLLCGGKNEMHD